MYKRYYIEIRDPSGKLKDFFLYDGVGEVRHALRLLNASRSLPEPGDAGPFQPMKGTFRIGYNLGTYELDPNDRYLADQLYSEHVPSLLVLSPVEIERMAERVPLPIIEAAKELEARRLSKGYLPSLVETYLSRYRDLYLALLAVVITATVSTFFSDCDSWLNGVVYSHSTSTIYAISTFAVGTMTIGFLVYRHFREWTPVFWLCGLSALVIFMAFGLSGQANCQRIFES